MWIRRLAGRNLNHRSLAQKDQSLNHFQLLHRRRSFFWCRIDFVYDIHFRDSWRMFVFDPKGFWFPCSFCWVFVQYNWELVEFWIQKCWKMNKLRMILNQSTYLSCFFSFLPHFRGDLRILWGFWVFFSFSKLIGWRGNWGNWRGGRRGSWVVAGVFFGLWSFVFPAAGEGLCWFLSVSRGSFCRLSSRRHPLWRSSEKIRKCRSWRRRRCNGAHCSRRSSGRLRRRPARRNLSAGEVICWRSYLACRRVGW